MAGIYIHIPFCKQACHYCDFHFSTSLKKKTDIIEALSKEIVLRKNEVSEKIETIYFGGGTPSILSVDEITFLINSIYDNYQVVSEPEITLEANPDDLHSKKVKALSQTKINRLSIGVQSFFEDDLKLMNRAHNANQAIRCLEETTKYFSNISIDLIYGIQGMSVEKWKKNIHKALSFNIPHISSYALTVEPKTALAKFIKIGTLDNVDDDLAQQHFEVLVQTLEANRFIHYELSNFGKEGYFSKNNTAYWSGVNYLGIGPSAHSFDGKKRSWNINNNTKYLHSIHNNFLPKETENLSVTDQYNETIMTGLRTIWGISIAKIENEYGAPYKKHLLKQADRFIKENLLTFADDNKTLKTTKKGKFLADGITAHLFMLNDIA